MSPRSTYDFPVDRIYHGDSRHMQEVPDNKVSLIVCSPPYNVRKPYANHDDDMPVDEYRALLKAVWTECHRVLRPGGRLCINVAGVWRQPYLPLHALIWQQLTDELEFLMRGEIIWDKGASVGVSTAWGSFASPSNPTIRDVHEQVLIAAKNAGRVAAEHEIVSVYSKESFRLEKAREEEADIGHQDFAEWTQSVWRIATESSSRVGHPAPFPVELPLRLMLLYTYPGDLVLDPFAGSGSTCVAARIADRHYIGYDTDADYVRVARERVGRAGKQLVIPGVEAKAQTKRSRSPRKKEILRMPATALVRRAERRDREIRVSTRGNEIQIGIKTAGKMVSTGDKQKQNVAANLPPADARRLAEHLMRAADAIESEEGDGSRQG